MGAVGFGAVSGSNGTYSAMYAFDESNSGAEEYGVSWPDQNMPVEYFGTNYAWSVSMGSQVTEENVKVTLTRLSDGETWTFSSSSADGAFYVNNGGYGQWGCIIFRPDGVGEYRPGDVFDVKIEGLDNPVSYRVNFFAVPDEEDNAGGGNDTGNDSGSGAGNDSGSGAGSETVQNGLQPGADGNWHYYKNGVVETGYTGLVYDENAG